MPTDPNPHNNRRQALAPLVKTAQKIMLEISSIEQNIDGDPRVYGLQGSLHPKRRREFLSGRQAAQRTLHALGCSDPLVKVHHDRAPIWPNGFCGSISHSQSLCVAVAGRRADVTSLGIDIERLGAITSEMAEVICQLKDDTDTLDPVTVFSAKEAFYKLWYPMMGTFLDFADVSIRQGHDNDNDIVATLNWLAPDPRLQQITGRRAFIQDHVLTFFALTPPNSPAALDPFAILHDLN